MQRAKRREKTFWNACTRMFVRSRLDIIYFFLHSWPFSCVWVGFCVRLLFFCVLSCAFEDNDVNTDNSGYCHHSNFHESSSFLHWQKNCTNEPNVKWFFNSIFQAIFSLYRAFNDTVVKKDVPRCLLWK